MKFNKYLSDNIITLTDVLEFRDNRQEKIIELINKYNTTVIVFSLNIVGPIKVFNLSKKTFNEGFSLILRLLNDNNYDIKYICINEQNYGLESYFVVDCNETEIKTKLCRVEDSSTLGRLFDIDVITNKGNKISREDIELEGRKCILCNSPVFICSRSRKHSVEDLINKEIEIMYSFFCNKIAQELSSIVVESLILEVNTTPKPGLVDLNNNGSHNDLNIDLFYKSAKDLKPFFKKFFLLGANFDSEINLLLPSLRQIGIEAEKAMFETTSNINTHKGAIFIFSLVLASLGYIYRNYQYSRELLVEMISFLSKNINDDFKNINRKNLLSNGERIFLNYGIKGVRGEALCGFDIVIKKAINLFNKYIEDGDCFNDSGVFTLLDILLLIDDTNIITRSDYNTLLFFKSKIENNSNLNKKDKIAFIEKLDKEFIKANISAGGSADLLALTYFIFLFESKLEKNFNLINS